jgi:hypothetical protein
MFMGKNSRQYLNAYVQALVNEGENHAAYWQGLVFFATREELSDDKRKLVNDVIYQTLHNCPYSAKKIKPLSALLENENHKQYFNEISKELHEKPPSSIMGKILGMIKNSTQRQ